MDPKTANQQHQDPLKCPRCDSSNTKFCYYNNYSLSQPRHFCKACKRYWTRGGTLRSVPVGGGCRKNKRFKRPPPPSNSTANTATTNPTVQSRIDLMSPNSSHMINNPLFYSHLTNPNELNFPFSSFRVSSDHHNGGLDFQPHMINGLGLGFSSSGLMESEVQNINDPYKNVNTTTATDNYNSMFFGSSNFAASSTMASLLASGLQHQKFNGLNKDIQSANNYQGLMPYEETQMGKEVKIERENRLDQWNPNPIQQINGSDPSALVWNTGTWFDPSNMGSSVPSLI